MIFNDSLKLAMSDCLFWEKFFGESVLASPYVADWEVVFPVGAGHSLIVQIEFEGDYSNSTLSLRSPGMAQPVLIAEDGLPYAFRLEELEQICRCIATLDPDLPHPGLPLLFLCRFTPICVGDDVNIIVPMLNAAWRAAGVGSDRVFAALTNSLDCRRDGFTWRRSESFGWYLYQSEEDRDRTEGEYRTLRDPEDPDAHEFPSRYLAGMLEAARNTCDCSIRPEWVVYDGGRVANLARKIIESGNLVAAPDLADVLEEAGCDHPTILGALRNDEPSQACWVVETIAGAEAGSLIRRHFRSDYIPSGP